MNVQVKYTYRDLLSTPDDGKRYEIIEGDLIMTPVPSVDHQAAITNLIKLISNYIDPLNLGRLLLHRSTSISMMKLRYSPTSSSFQQHAFKSSKNKE